MDADPTLEVDTWIGRAVLDRLAVHDRRYKHDYGGVEKTSDELLAACAQLDALAAGDGTGLPALDVVMQREEALEADVEATLETLEERGYVERVGERPRPGPLLGDPDADAGTTTVWEPTVDGRAQVRALREAYATAIDEVVASYVDDPPSSETGAERALDDPSADLPDECTHEMLEVARTYGVLPW